MTAVNVIGIDPGVTTGIFAWEIGYDVDPIALQARGNGTFLDDILQCLDSASPGDTTLAIEAFVPSPRSTRVGNTADIAATQKTIKQLQSYAVSVGWGVVLNPAVTVKKWATDKRLEAAGLLSATHEMRHARDAARHALYAAVFGGHLPDPLSNKSLSGRAAQ